MPNAPALPPFSCVLDTNIILDLFHFADAHALPLLEALQTGQLVCRYNAATLSELERVLTYPEFLLDELRASDLVSRYLRYCRPVDDAAIPSPPLPRCRDPDDQKFLVLAAATGAHFLISRDKALLALARKPGLPFRILNHQSLRELLPLQTVRPDIPAFRPPKSSPPVP